MSVCQLSDVNVSHTQAAHTALARSLQFEWGHLQRVIHDCADHFTGFLIICYTPPYWEALLSMNRIYLLSLLDFRAVRCHYKLQYPSLGIMIYLGIDTCMDCKMLVIGLLVHILTHF